MYIKGKYHRSITTYNNFMKYQEYIDALKSFDQVDYRVCAVDTETTGVLYHDKAFMISMAWWVDGDVYKVAFDLEADEKVHEVVDYLLSNTDLLIFHNAKFDIQKLQALGYLKDLMVQDFHDTMLLAYYENEHQDKSLKGLAKSKLGMETDEAEVLGKVCRELKIKKADGYYDVPRHILKPYAAADAEFTLTLYNHYQTTNPKLLGECSTDKEYLMTMLEVEGNGIRIDGEQLRITKMHLQVDCISLKRTLTTLAGDEFNPNSPKQILGYLHLRGHTEITSTGVSTLKAYRHITFVETLLEYRAKMKLLNTYVLNIEAEVGNDGLLHPNFNLAKSKTGRSTSSTPSN